MALVLKDRVKETTSTAGTGSITLAGPVQGYQGFSVIGNSNTTYYTIAGTSEWEVGIGTYSGGVLSRDTVLGSSANGSKVAFSAGVKDVFVTYPADKAISTDTLPVTGATNTASPNATVNVASLTAATTTANGDLALVAKGTGALLGQVPTGTTAGGNKRGAYAVDWVRLRTNTAQVASGDYSVISGGYDNKASASYSAVAGGQGNFATGNSSFVGGGLSNTNSGQYASLVGGRTNSLTGDYGAIGGGLSNTASSPYATISGGRSNTASRDYSTVGGGLSNTATGAISGDNFATVGGGTTNTVNAKSGTIAGGDTNSVTGVGGSIGGGEVNTVSGSRGTVAGGLTNTASGQNSSITGGANNLADSKNGVVVGGVYGTTRGIIGYAVFPSHDSPIAAAAGVSQGGLVILGRETTNNTPTVLRSNTSAAGTTNQLILANNSAVYVFGYVIANVTGAGDTKSWIMSATVKRGANAASTTVVGSLIASQQADAGASAWDVTVAADTTNGGLAVTVTGQASTTIRWVCKLESVEVAY
jgi:hypothetical protein